MWMLFLLAACSKDPAPIAKQTCEALPLLATDPQGLALLEPLLTARDFNALEEAEPTEGLRLVGEEGVAALRAKVACEVKNVKPVSGGWEVTLEQRVPEVKPDGTLGDLQSHEFTWTVKRGRDLHVNTGLFRASAMRRKVEYAIEDDNYVRASALWRELQEQFPDPLIAVDIARTDAVAIERAYREKMRGNLVAIEAGEEPGSKVLKAELTNRGGRNVSEVLVQVRFDVGESVEAVETRVGPLESGKTEPFQVDVPEGADGGVHLVTTRVTFGDETGQEEGEQKEQDEAGDPSDPAGSP